MADTITDRELLAADLSDEPACEHPQHGTDSPFHADGDEHYIKFITPCGHYGDGVAVVCGQWVRTLRAVWCAPCDVTYLACDAVVVLGPVRDFR